MYIFVMRHGDAVYSSHNDEQRPLSELGMSESREAAKWLKEFETSTGIEITHALVSPFLRAQQTLEQVSPLLNLQEIQNNPDIVPSGNCRLVHDFIDAYSKQQQSLAGLLLVSHMPFVSYLIDELCGQSFSRIFAAGAVVCIEYDLQQSIGCIYSDFTP
jgi:phosphohistidine phosphatase